MKIRALLAVIVELLLLGIVAGSSQERAADGRSSVGARQMDLLFVQAPVVRPEAFPNRFPQGSRLVRLPAAQTSDPPQPLTPDFYAAADPEISFDGTRILFSGKKSVAEHWHVWEMNVDGSEQRQVTNCAEDCLRAAYLPGGEIVYTGIRQGSQSELFVSKLDGSEAHRITFGPGDFRVETVLQDGRILASASSPLLPGRLGSRILYTLRPDGTGLESFRSESFSAGASSDAEELADGSVAYVRGPEERGATGGKLVIIRRGATQALILNPEDGFASPRSISPEQTAVARWISGNQQAPGRFELYEFNPENGSVSKRIFANPRLSCVQAVAVAPHRAPRLFWSTLKPEEKAGFVISLNSYLNAESPKGRLPVPITQVRVSKLIVAENREEVLGTAPVEADGSFYVTVPADHPVRFELLDVQGQIVKAEQGWNWVRPGEEHGCVGCHADKAVVPENRWPLTLKRLDTPWRLGIRDDAAGQ